MTETPLLLTPGPLTTHADVRAAMNRDWGSRDRAFIALTAELRERLLSVVNGAGSHVAIPIQGSGTYVLEAAVASLMHPGDRLLVLANGAYGERMATIAARMGRAVDLLRFRENRPVDPAAVADALAADPAITHVAVVHCETTSGILNPLPAVAAAVAASRRRLIVDCMSSFGALPIDLSTLPAAALLASGNKCLEGAPGVAFAIVSQDLIAASAGNSPSVSLDLHAQWKGFGKDGQWRFTPPVQVVAALVTALRLLEAEGGPEARLARYRANLETLMAGARGLGILPYLDADVQAPIIATFLPPRPFDFPRFYEALLARGFAIYPGKLTQEESFRIGCIGQVTPADMERLVTAMAEALGEASVS